MVDTDKRPSSTQGIQIVGCLMYDDDKDDYCGKPAEWRPANIPMAPFEWFCREHAVEIAQREGVYGVYHVHRKDVVEEIDATDARGS